MRTAFFRALHNIAAQDHRVTLVVGDLGFGVVEPFAEAFPERFLNVGVAEQNMTGVAAGLALMGRTVFTYSIANFPTLRCLEQIRNDICYHKASVKIIAVGGGFSYGSLGMTHHATEDIAIMRALPEMTVVAPGDPVETEAATAAITALRGPCYLRLGRAGEPVVHKNPVEFRLGKALQLRDGADLTIMTTGAMLHTAVQVADALATKGCECRVLSMHTIKPFDSEAVIRAASETRALITIEEHSLIGGLGSCVAEVLAESNCPHVPFKRIGLDSHFASVVGSQSYLRNHCGLSVDSILGTVNAVLESVRTSQDL